MNARVSKLVNELDSKSSARKGLGVQVSPLAQFFVVKYLGYEQHFQLLSKFDFLG